MGILGFAFSIILVLAIMQLPPLLVILLGAIGGMITSGIIGLFIGAIILALGYQLFRASLYQDEDNPEPE